MYWFVSCSTWISSNDTISNCFGTPFVFLSNDINVFLNVRFFSSNIIPESVSRRSILISMQGLLRSQWYSFPKSFCFYGPYRCFHFPSVMMPFTIHYYNLRLCLCLSVWLSVCLSVSLSLSILILNIMTDFWKLSNTVKTSLCPCSS